MDERNKNILLFIAIIIAIFPITYLIVMFACS